MRTRLTLLVCVLAAACGGGRRPVAFGHGQGHDSKGNSACTIVVAVDDDSIDAPDLVRCSRNAEVVFVFINFGTVTHNVSIGAAMGDRGQDENHQPSGKKHVLVNDVYSSPIDPQQQRWTLMSANVDPQANQGESHHFFKYTVICPDCSAKPLDPDIDIMM